MALFKRGKTWWVDFTTPAGERVRETSGSRDRNQAQEYHDKLKAEAWRVFKLGDRPDHTWDEAAHRWLLEKKHLRSYKNTKVVIAWWHQHFRGKLLRDITRETIQIALDTKAGIWAPGTIKRNLEILGAILHRAADEWEWLDRVPKRPQAPKVQRRIRWLTPAEMQRLLQHLPEATAEMARFALATGLRRNNVLRLEWSQVDTARRVCWIYGDQAKAGKDIHVSLNETALAVLERQRGKHERFVFVGKRGKPQTQIYAEGWRAALKAAGIENFRWHDLRHTWASWLAQEGTPLHVLQEMGGWADYGMVLRYAHLSPERFATHASVVDQKMNVTISAQPGA
ncbi:site-specific integrase [Azonexus hydrophilus]|uniref:Site-specific integrase n=1 Tax=Azonexus hydrophilus TaxID=418702 RepID=A0ABZ2XN19_9RHOO